jgi:DinB superfamily
VAGSPGSTRRSWLRELMSSLVNTLPRWYFTVRELMNNRAPISGSDRPVRASLAITASWAVSSPRVSMVRLRAVIEVVAHLADTEERALARVRRMEAEDEPELAPFDQEALAEERHYLDLDLEGELARLEQLREQHVAELEGLDGSGWERTGRHGQHGRMSVELYETHVAAEEVDHLAQVARLR